MWIIPLIFLIAFMFLIRGIFGLGSGGNSHHPESALEILDKQFAKGEISKVEYEEMKKVLAK